MKIKKKMQEYYEAIDQTFLKQYGFRIKKTTFPKIVKYLHEPKDASSLAVTRILFGLSMLFDITDERGGATMERRWGGQTCHFPLLPFLVAMPMPYIGLVYAAMWLGALGITIGYKFRVSSVMFTVCYWYLFLIEKSYWNNHSYLFGLVALLLSCTQANCLWSIDAYLDPSTEKQTVPYWNYFLLKYQFFILYFMAGMKKGTAEWLTGYSVQQLAQHWVFDPFKLFLTVPQIDYLIVHCFIFIFDLTIAFWMMWKRTRHIAMVFCAMFHLMNSRLFTIGMFPWVCLATMPLYYPFDWPKTLSQYLKELYYEMKSIICDKFKVLKKCSIFNCKAKKDDMNKDNNDVFENLNDLRGHKLERDNEHTDEKTVEEKHYDDETNEENEDLKRDDKIEDNSSEKQNFVKDEKAASENEKHSSGDTDDNLKKSRNIGQREHFTTCLILLYVFIQAFLPYSHFITKGYNNWTNGLYGYSWDMMVHTWYTDSVVVKIVDNENNEEFYIEPSAYAPNDRWTRHGDMVYQYAKCLNQNLLKERAKFAKPEISANLSVYVEIWCSMNGRFSQRLFDSKVDLLKVSWSPFEKVSFLMPLLDEALHWRATLQQITDDVYSWSNQSNVLFLADFPNYELVKYIPQELSNVTLTILEGAVAYQPETITSRSRMSYKLTKGERIKVDTESFHKVLNIGETNAYYMYTFVNNSEIISNSNKVVKSKLPIFKELYGRFKGMVIFARLVGTTFRQILSGCNGGC